MPDSNLHAARVRGAFETALRDEGAAGGWVPPAPEAIGPLFPAFEIEALLGRGGMGAVYRARQKSLDRLVAIKLLPFELGVREDFAERFRREATSLARLSHPHIVAVHDFGQADDGHFFMVMEYVEGSDLAARLQAGPLPPEDALAIVRQVCDALEFAHSQGVVHRDIKPGNVLLDATGRVKVTDFGIAQLAGDEPRTALTATGVMLGTPEYVAPEQMLPAATVDHRADIFSVGVMLYELLTGQLPRGVFRPLAQLVPAARSLDRVLTRALQSEPGRRFSSVRELSAELTVLDRPRPAWRVAALFVVAAALAALVWWQSAPPAPTPAAFTNSLGLRFVPAGTPGVFFCTTETRLRDFTAFAHAQSMEAYGPMWVNFAGAEEGWHSVNATWKQPGFAQTDEHPVVGVTQIEAIAFCEWLTAHERASGRIGAEDRYRLPTNEEWSVAVGLDADAHFPSGRYPWGAHFPPPNPAGNYASDETRGAEGEHAALDVIAGYRDGHAFTAPVGSFAPDAHGLHDLGGNVWEWTDDGPDRPSTLRGASWWDSRAAKLDAACAVTHERNLRCYCFGFRAVLERKAAPR
ncbi:MAG: bifunctional serine/threonine-protein kinase/formylglycine-generating enzyme family protein [Chthoniobacteraceae bacterium]